MDVDPLTNLHSRYCIYDKLSQGIEQAKKNNTQLLVICMDLDHFKTINDVFNHEVGDKNASKSSSAFIVCIA